MTLEMTRDGYAAARDYLIAIGRIGDIEHELSTDGFTLVALANAIQTRTEQNGQAEGIA